MIDYNERFENWVAKAKADNKHAMKDFSEEEANEFMHLLLLAEIPFRETYGGSPEQLQKLLRHLLREEDYHDEKGQPLRIAGIDSKPRFQSPVNGIVTYPLTYAEDERGRRFVFYHCDYRGPNVTQQAAAFDAIHEEYHKLGVEPNEFPEIFFIYLSDYDLSRKGQFIIRIDFLEDIEPHTDREWIEAGCDPNQPDPVMSKLHIILCDVNKFQLK